jgi:sec-independent protein translocase protein TatB
MLNLDPGKLLVIGVVAIILLGPDRLPQVARQIGGAWRTFNEFRHRMESEVRDTMPDLPPTSEIARLARSPSALLNHLSNMASDEEPDGSFQPPNLQGENGAAGPVADVDADSVTTAAAETEEGAGAPALPEQAPAPAHPSPLLPPTAPVPPTVVRPTRAPQPSGVVVPGDPTLN